jgi:hypothetical protein
VITKMSDPIPPSILRSGDPPTKHAELTVYALGHDEDAIIPALRLLGDFSRRELRRFQGSLPCTMTLPGTYYDKSDTFVSLLRSSGTIFRIKGYPWMCPEEQELTGTPHLCSGACSIVRVEEVIS